MLFGSVEAGLQKLMDRDRELLEATITSDTSLDAIDILNHPACSWLVFSCLSTNNPRSFSSTVLLRDMV